MAASLAGRAETGRYGNVKAPVSRLHYTISDFHVNRVYGGEGRRGARFERCGDGYHRLIRKETTGKGPAGPAPEVKGGYSTVIFFTLCTAASVLGIRTSSTPSLKLALALSDWISLGSRRVRVKEPKDRSRR